MADFNEAIKITLQHEGGYVDNPADPGGATNMGIEQKEWNRGDIRDLTVEDATEFYAERYWHPLYNQIASQSLANKLFDTGVFLGEGTAVRRLQIAVGLSKCDGLFGPQTLQAVNADSNALVKFKEQLVIYVQSLINRNQSLQEFAQGWLNRVNS